MNSFRGFFVASGISALVLAGGLFVAPQVSAQSSSPGCFAPCDAANTYLSQLGYLENQLSSNLGRCRSQCGSIRKGCFNAVAASERCFRGSVNSVLEFDRTACGDLQGSAQGPCNSDISSESQSVEGFLRDNVACGKTDCEEAFQDCLLTCTSD
jgi:hypothetical protein